MESAETSHRLLASVLGPEEACGVLATLLVAPSLTTGGQRVSRAQLAMTLNAALFSQLLGRVPTAARYVHSVTESAGRICFDHGALRTIDGPTGALPRGYRAFERILKPLGYELAGLYPLPRLRMTGRAFTQTDLPEDIPQFFVSELHVSELPQGARNAAARVFGASADPLGAAEWALLDELAREGTCDFETAVAGLPGIVRAFGAQHGTPALADYETLLAASPEGAWIATEGNAFNHATDRVPNVAGLSEALKAQGYPMKAALEVSANGRVRQTAFIADKVRRHFLLPDASATEREVPGSFYEFISRDRVPETGALDLSFDSGNATGIFAVTQAQ
ncbi:MAG: DUF1338 family protein [Sphingobium sp.]|nr:DUF1338 family protein [Sphingobium sp.]